MEYIVQTNNLVKNFKEKQVIKNVSTMSASSSMIITGIVGAIVFGTIFCFLGALINKKVEV